MDEKQEWRLANLSRPDVEPEFLEELHGLVWPFDGDLHADFMQVLDGMQSKPALTCNLAPRFHIERFFDIQGLDSIRFAAARLGMDTDSLRGLLPLLPKLGLRTNYQPYAGLGLIGRSLSEDLTKKLPGLRFKTFGTHDSFCELLHQALKKALTLDVTPLYCATQDELAADKNGFRMFASTWDNLTMQPLSGRHQVWLSLGKPLSLTPDRCSKLFYARNRDRLRGHLVGRGEPQDIDEYMRFLGVTQVA
jgi:hypothetical protein